MTFQNPRSEGRESVKTNLVTFVCLDCGFVDHIAYKGETNLNKFIPNIQSAQAHANRFGHRITNFMSVQWIYSGVGVTI